LKIQYMDDLHIEFGNPILPKNIGGTDILILAGDIILTYHLIDQNPKRRKLYNKFFSHISKEFPMVIMVGGNHELYGWKEKQLIEHGHYIDVIKKHLSAYPNIHFLENQFIDIGDLRFVGSTFWTDFGGANPLIMAQAKGSMNDYNWAYSPEDALRWHYESFNFLKSAIRDHKNVVVITHHAPSYLSVGPNFRGHPMNPAYATELFDFIMDNQQIMYWFHGHMHHTVNYKIGETRVLTNPYGYHAVEKNHEFDKEAFVEFMPEISLQQVETH
jgi:Icc-related predicted phosphoesterase